MKLRFVRAAEYTHTPPLRATLEAEPGAGCPAQRSRSRSADFQAGRKLALRAAFNPPRCKHFITPALTLAAARVAFPEIGNDKKAMKTIARLCGLAAIAALAGASAKDFPLEFRTLDAKEAMSLPGGWVQGTVLRASPRPLKNEPKARCSPPCSSSAS